MLLLLFGFRERESNVEGMGTWDSGEREREWESESDEKYFGAFTVR